MKKAYDLAEVIINEINNYSEMYTSEDGQTTTTQDSIMALNSIIEKGLSLYKYLQENKLYEGKPNIIVVMNTLAGYVDKLQINKKNAENLNLSNAIQLWNQCKICIAMLACELLDFRDSLN